MVSLLNDPNDLFQSKWERPSEIDQKLNAAIIKTLSHKRVTSLLAPWVRRERDLFNKRLQRKRSNDPKNISKGEIIRQLAKMTGSIC